MNPCQILAAVVIVVVSVAVVMLCGVCRICGTHRCLTKEDCEQVRKGEL